MSSNIIRLDCENPNEERVVSFLVNDPNFQEFTEDEIRMGLKRICLEGKDKEFNAFLFTYQRGVSSESPTSLVNSSSQQSEHLD